MSSAWTRRGTAALCVCALVAAACSSDGGEAVDESSLVADDVGPDGTDVGAQVECVDTAETSQDPQVDEVLAVVRDSMAEQDLRAVALSIQRGGDDVVTTAFGETVNGVAATPDMRFWNGAIVFSYLGTVMLQLDDEGVLDIDEPIVRWLPDPPEAARITPRMLMASMSGYTDYVADDDFIDQLYADPFRAFTQDELEAYVFEQPLRFEPGTNVGYSHLNFRLAGEVIEAATGEPLADVMTERIIEPLGLAATSILFDSDMPGPRLHMFTDERGTYEDSSLWSAAWGVPEGAAMATTVCDVVTANTVIAGGELLSDESYEDFLDPGTLAVGRRTDACPTCIPMTDELHLGLGITNAGDWIIQTPLFTGIAGVQAYLPSEDLSVAIANTFGPDADVGVNGSTAILRRLVPVIAPESSFPDFG